MFAQKEYLGTINEDTVKSTVYAMVNNLFSEKVACMLCFVQSSNPEAIKKIELKNTVGLSMIKGESYLIK